MRQGKVEPFGELSIQIDTRKIPNGVHVACVQTYDTAGNMLASNPYFFRTDQAIVGAPAVEWWPSQLAEDPPPIFLNVTGK